MTRLTTWLAVLVAAIAITACGESSEDKAQTTVCDARDDISKQVNELKGITPATFTTDAVSKSLESIKSDLSEMRDAQANLSDDRRQEVESANQAFADQLRNVVQEVGRSVTASDASSQVTQALQQLAAGYEQAFSRIDCS
jgi:uncharacterized membrane-anchored protein YjiN (DUF445 family)